jgi:primary-amine oxidase
MSPHPLSNLSLEETNYARSIILTTEDTGVVIHFRSIFLQEPAKKDLVLFLEVEHSGRLNVDSARPARLAQCHYDVVQGDKAFHSYETIVKLDSGEVIKKELIHESHHAMLTMYVHKIESRRIELIRA